ncbi:phage terminase small subunit P27 family [Oryzobacter sp. R7]|uniref:phage terminase small subunit P27 family n=1 Tax=Oryzobacter faecalis TaxID=3388656 RepID=UPI00398CE5C9
MGPKLKLLNDSPLRVLDPERLVVDATLGGNGLDWWVVPGDLEGVGRESWEHLRTTFANDPTRFREADRRAVAAYCSAVEMAAAAAAALREHGVLVDGRSNSDEGKRPVRSPAWAMWRDASTQVRQWSNELGLSPSARYRMKIAEPGVVGEGNPFAAPPRDH